MQTEAYKRAVELRLSQIIRHEISTAPTDQSRVLLKRISSLILRSGKRFRPLLLLTTYAAYGSKNPDDLINLAAALELMHQGLLIHDDIMDRDNVRYDGPNISGYYEQDIQLGGTNIPSSMALLAGDLALTLSSKYIIEDPNLTPESKLKILSTLSQTTTGVVYGQQLDLLNSVNKPDELNEAQMEQIHYLKAALYTTCQPMKLAAIILGLSDQQIKLIDNFAKVFGIYFQLVDDYADYFATKTDFDRRPKFRDYAAGKPTLPYIIGLKLASQKDRDFLKSNFGQKPLANKVISRLTSILDKSGARNASQIQALKYYDQSMSALNNLAIKANQKRDFTKLLESIKI